MRTFVSKISALLVLLFVGGGLFHPAQAQLHKIEQTVFGMDCAPCAHAMEQSLGAMEGVESVSVSLNTGVAAIDLSETNKVTYGEIRKTVSNGGFAAKDATLEAKGTLRREGDQWILETPAGEQFVLKADDEAASAEGGLQDLKPDQRVTITGQVPASSETGDKRWTIRVQRVRPAA